MTAAHGTKARYDRQRCRCADCRGANTAYMRRYRARNSTRPSLDPTGVTRATSGRFKRFCVACSTWFRTNDRTAVRCTRHEEMA